MNMALKEEGTKVYRGELINDVSFIYDASKDYQDLFKGYRKFTKWQKGHLNKIAPFIQYENVIFASKEELQDKLGIPDQGNLLRLFRQVGHLVEVTSNRNDPENVPVGYLKVVVNPLYLWRPSLTKSRADAVKDWYRFRDLSEDSKRDVCLTPYYRDIYPNIKLLDNIGKI